MDQEARGVVWWLYAMFTLFWACFLEAKSRFAIYATAKLFGAKTAHKYLFPKQHSKVVGKLTPEEFVSSYGSYNAWKMCCKCYKLDIFKTVREGGEAYNASVVTADGKQCRLLDFEKRGRPLILNFGSCTWPPFIEAFDQFCKMAQDFSDVADFLVIYIEEAHSSTTWYFPGNYHQFADHTTINDRIQAASVLVERNPPFPVVSDVMTDDANLAYGGYFERLYVIKDGLIEVVGGKGPYEYDVGVIREWLEDYSQKKV